ncbi:hypothetical protein DdX_10898 [Ditylenchus destructor]|uniref:Uncharacterized protein n=1 Tax=Ditylenchus destructor TaxID=166010 RepID=A0AAD4MYG6_9BILA|nr:hypothetical protein DdX_10898 [Ditylenchus destructor]
MHYEIGYISLHCMYFYFKIGFFKGMFIIAKQLMNDFNDRITHQLVTTTKHCLIEQLIKQRSNQQLVTIVVPVVGVVWVPIDRWFDK